MADLGFTFEVRKIASVLIYHWGKLAITLRGAKARDFIDEVDGYDFGEQQQLMARLTGNYKRGNERRAKNHPKNK